MGCKVAASPGCPLTEGRGEPVARQFWESQAHGASRLFQERIFLTVSNYIFTAIFVGEMTLKVVLPHLRPLPLPAGGWALALVQPALSLSISNIAQGPRSPHPWAPAPGL